MLEAAKCPAYAAHGRRKMYSAGQVEAALGKAQFSPGQALWAVSVFCTDAEFADYCARLGVAADYRGTRATALDHLNTPRSGHVAKLAAGAIAAGAMGTVAAAQISQAGSENGIRGALDAASDVFDVVGCIFDFLDIFN